MPNKDANTTALLSPDLLPLLSRLLAQNPAPQAYTSYGKPQPSPTFWLKLDTNLTSGEDLPLFTVANQPVYLSRTQHEQFNRSAESLGSNNLEYQHLLKTGGSECNLDVMVGNELMDVQGWNLYEVRDA